MSGPGTQPRWQPADADRLPGSLASWIASLDGSPRIAIDGPPCGGPHAFAESLVAPLRALGRPAVHVRAETFWRDASLRLEHGHEDVLSFPSWLDDGALRRETLDPFGRGAPYLTSLRDPVTDRATREAARAFVPGSVLLVSGAFLVGTALPFERTVHLYLPAEARARRTSPDQSWTLPAFDEHDRTVGPADIADVTVRLDRRSPAVRCRSGIGLSAGVLS